MKAVRLHVIGCPRSGTTLITELLRYAYRFGGAAAHEQSLFDPIADGQSPYLSKKPADTVRIGKAFEQDEALYVIGMIRDPRAVITSIHWAHPDQYFVGFARWRLYAEALQRYALHPRFLLIRYEDLLQTPATIQREIEARFPFLARRRSFTDYPEGVATLHHHATKALNGIRAFDTERIEAWRAHPGRIRAELDGNPDFIQALVQFGYEKNSDWTGALADVAPAGSSYKDAGDRWPGRWEIALRYWWKTRRYLAARRRAN